MSDRLQDAARLYAARSLPATEAVWRGISCGQPDHFDAADLLNVLLTLMGRPTEALPYLRLAQAGMPNQPPLRTNLGSALLVLRRLRCPTSPTASY